MNRTKKLLTNYNYKRVDEISPFAHAVIASILASSYISDGKTRVAPLQDAVIKLDEFTRTHGELTPTLTAELDGLRRTVLSQLSKLATGLNTDYAGDETALRSSGFELAADPVAKKPPVAPAKCEIVAGLQSGTMLARLKRAPESINVIWYYTTDPTLPLGQWTMELCNTDELTIAGLTPGTRLYVKAACLNGASDTRNLLFAEAKPKYVE